MKALPVGNSWLRAFPASFILLFALQGASYALDVTLEWEANKEPNLAGYILYYATDSDAPYNPSPGDYLEGYSVDGGDTWHAVPAAPPIWVGAAIIKVTVRLPSNDKDYYFAVRAYDSSGNVSAYSREVCIISPGRIKPPYNRGWGVTSGDFEGLMIFYNTDTDAVTPSLGRQEDIPSFNIPGLMALGIPLSLQPPGAVFKQPIWIEFPAPGFSNMNQLSLGLYDDNMWRLVWDGEKQSLTAEGEGWLDGKPAYNTDQDPHTVSIVVKHFSGVQAAAPAGSTITVSGGGGGCFISTVGGRKD